MTINANQTQEAELKILSLINRAEKEHGPMGAMQWTQAALNAANALLTLQGVKAK